LKKKAQPQIQKHVKEYKRRKFPQDVGKKITKNKKNAF
jgi:hypothetical protein